MFVDGGPFARERSELSNVLCRASLSDMHLQPISWQPGQAKATPNPFSWTNLSSIIFVEQPVGTGFSQGVPTATVCCTINSQT